uniref:Odorant receptor n=1 Tax=Culicoides sonorensis TaxID=179676 RepID=A0A336M464_CULSO
MIKVVPFKKEENPILLPYVRFWAKVYGYWPVKSQISLRRVLILFYFMLIHVPMIIYAVNNFDNSAELCLVLCEIIPATMHYPKIFSVFWYNDLYADVLCDLETAWKLANDSNISKWHQIEKEFRISIKTTIKRSYMLTIIASFNFVVLAGLMQAIRVYGFHFNEKLTVGLHLDYLVDFRNPDHPFLFVTFLGIAYFVCNFFGMSFITINLFYFGTIKYMATYFKYIGACIEQLDDEFDALSDKKLITKLKEIVRLHDAAFCMVEKLNQGMSIQFIWQYVINGFFLCIVSVNMLVVSPRPETFAQMLGFAVVVSMDLFICSTASEMLRTEGKQIATLIWNLKWYNRSSKIVFLVQFILARSQKPVYITAGSFYTVSLESFRKVVSAGASYFTLLKTFL